MKIAKCMAVFMTVLVVMIPIYSASVYADLKGTFHGAVVSGGAKPGDLGGIPGYRNVTDTLTATVIVTLVNIVTDEVYEITQDWLEIEIAGQRHPFNNGCGGGAQGKYVCSFSQSQPTSYTGPDQKVMIYLQDDYGTNQADVRRNVRVDKLAPTLTIPDARQDQDGITLTFNIEERAYGINPNLCSGVRKLELREDGRLINTTLLPKSPDANCNIKPYEFNFISPYEGVGTREYEITVYDGVGNSASVVKNWYVDATKPLIHTDTFRLVDSRGRTVHSVEPGVVTTVDVYVNITENSSLQSVVADFSDLGLDASVPYDDISTSDTMHQVKWENIQFQIDETTTYVVIPVTAVDDKGNLRETYIQYELAWEATVPDIRFMKLLINNEEMHYLPGGPFTEAKITVDIFEEDPGLDTNGVWIDLTPMMGNAQARPNYCVENLTNNVWTCTWDPVQLELQTGTVDTFKIHAEDLFGNGVTAIVPYVIDRDTEEPEIEFFGTPWLADPSQDVDYESFIMTGTNRFIVEIDERFSGINKDNVKMSMSTAGVLETFPNSCEKLANNWFCYWEDVNVVSEKGGKYTAQVSVRDNVGNVDAGSFDVFLDNETPKFVSVEAYSITSAGPVIYHKTGDSVQFKVTVEDDSPPTLSMDLSEIGESRNVTVPCDYVSDNKWICEYQTSMIPVLGPEETEIGITAYDAVGNAKDLNGRDGDLDLGFIENKDLIGLSISTDGDDLILEILEVETTPSMDLWQVKDTQSRPEKIDRQTVAEIQQRMYFWFELGPRVQDVDIVDITLGSCEGENTDHIASFTLANVGGKNKKNPCLVAELTTTEAEIDSIEFECNLSITSKQRQKFYATPQVLTVDAEVLFYNMPLGELGKELEDDIKDASEGWLSPDSDFASVIGTLEDVMDIARQVCNGLRIVDNAVNVMNGIAVALDPLRATVVGEGVGVAYCEGTDAFSSTEPYLWEATGVFCKFISCQIGLGEILKEAGVEGDAVDWLQKADKDLKRFWGEVGALGGPFGGLLETGKTKEGEREVLGREASTYFDPMNSIVVAVFQLCLPGVIHGLNKIRQIECQRVYCLKYYVPQGIPSNVCDDNYDYMMCKYVAGAIMRATPLVIYDYLVNAIHDSLVDPLTMVGFGFNVFCSLDCLISGSAYGICQVFKWAGMVGNLAQDLTLVFDPPEGQGFFDTLLESKADLCDLLEEEGEE